MMMIRLGLQHKHPNDPIRHGVLRGMRVYCTAGTSKCRSDLTQAHELDHPDDRMMMPTGGERNCCRSGSGWWSGSTGWVKSRSSNVCSEPSKSTPSLHGSVLFPESLMNCLVSVQQRDTWSLDPTRALQYHDDDVLRSACSHSEHVWAELSTLDPGLLAWTTRLTSGVQKLREKETFQVCCMA
eukprot:548322-Rhodomonas_salina.2